MGYDIYEIIEDLEGTCNTLPEIDFTTQDLGIIDENIFWGDTCGWWYSVDCMALDEDDICEECA